MFKEILVPVDGTPAGEYALTHAVALARRFDAHVEIMRAVELLPAGLMSVEETARARGEQMRQADAYLAGVSKRLRAQGVRADWTVAPGDAARAVLRCANDIRPDLIALNSYGAGDAPALGSVAEKIIRHAKCPVLVIREPARPDEREAEDPGAALVADAACSAGAR